MLILTLSTLMGCLPKVWQKQCLEHDNCEQFNLIASDPPSEKPFRISHEDTSLQVRFRTFHLEGAEMKAYSEGMKLCRGMHLSKDTYQLENEKLLQRIYRNYKFTKDNFVPGEYVPCGEWKETDSKITVSASFPSNEEQPVLIPLVSSNNEHRIPFNLLGLGMLINPNEPSLDYVAISDSISSPFTEVLPEQNTAWLCSSLTQLSEINAAGEVADWNLIFDTPNGKLFLPYQVEGSAVLALQKSKIQKCNTSDKNHVIGIIRASAKQHPDGYQELNQLLQDVFGLKISANKTQNTQNTTAPKNTPRSTEVPKRTENKAMVGTYRCTASGQIAYLRIYRDGTFRLKVELQNGSASGTCSSNQCEIDSIYKSAIAFTGGVQSFTIQRRSTAIILNNKTRCELR
jgi:hypothetical protein